MAKLTLTEAAHLTETSRNTLYRAVRAGRLSRDPDGRFDTAELLRAGFTLRPPASPPRADEFAAASKPVSAFEALAQLRDAVAHERTLWERERELLVRELAAAHEREARLLQLLQAEQQQRLLTAGPALQARPRGWRAWLQRWLAGA